jgi:hypothetical protein
MGFALPPPSYLVRCVPRAVWKGSVGAGWGKALSSGFVAQIVFVCVPMPRGGVHIRGRLGKGAVIRFRGADYVCVRPLRRVGGP